MGLGRETGGWGREFLLEGMVLFFAKGYEGFKEHGVWRRVRELKC